MSSKKSVSQWFKIVQEFKSSGLNLTAWCKVNNVSKSSIYPYLKKFNSQCEPTNQQWGTVFIPKSVDESKISLKIGAITVNINNGFEKETLTDLLNVVLKIC